MGRYLAFACALAAIMATIPAAASAQALDIKHFN
jgi:hypothetical protein